MLDFMGIGAQKAGTSWVFQQLRQHPQVAFPAGKEIHFWDQKRAKGLDWYKGLFQQPDKSPAMPPLRQGEITPAYAGLAGPIIADIRAHAPDVKLFYVLRNPIDRAWSSAEMARVRAELRPEEASDQWYQDHFLSDGSRQRGDYLLNIQAWHEHFPPEQLLLLDYGDIQRNPRGLLKRLAQHLDIDPQEFDRWPQDSLQQKVFKGTGQALRPSLIPLLTELYHSDIKALAKRQDCAFAANWRLPVNHLTSNQSDQSPDSKKPALQRQEERPAPASPNRINRANQVNLTNNGERRGLLIMGMHRSGSSVCAHLCHLLGADLGAASGEGLMQADQFNPRGYWENLRLTKFHEGILASEGASWKQMDRLPDGWLDNAASSPIRKAVLSCLNRSFSGRPLWAVKDPRLSFMAPLYHRFQPFLGAELASLVMLRHPSAVAASLNKRDRFSKKQALQLWLDYNLAAEENSRSGPRAFLLYDAVLADWRAAYADLTEQLELVWPNHVDDIESTVATFLSPDLNHHALDSALRAPDGKSADPLEELALSVFTLLKQLIANPWDQDVQQTLSAIKQMDRSAL